MIRLFYKYTGFISSICLLIALSGCHNEEPAGGYVDDIRGVPLSVKVELKGGGSAETRAARTNKDDQWSYVAFEEGDEMGFYASGGNWLNGNINDPFINYKLTYQTQNGRFNGETDAVFYPSAMNGNEVLMYFPYYPDMTDQGMPLRVSDEGVEKCRDFLLSNQLNIQGQQDGQEIVLFGTIEHAFAELIIVRGEGFDNPPPDKRDITAVISTGITNIKINYDPEDGWNCSPVLVYDSNSGLTPAEAQEWVAWQGGNYDLTQTDQEGSEAWYVIIPTLASSNTYVDYIEICDNDGYYQQVSSLTLAGAKNVVPGWRYPIEITMKELVPTVNPFRIVPWGANVDLTDQRTRGISTLQEFEEWVLDYNAYLADPDTQEKIDALMKYGDKTTNIATSAVSWQFYLLNDIDLSGYEPLDETMKNYTLILPELAAGDVLNGQSTDLDNFVFRNYVLSGLNKTFIGTLSGELQNIDFYEPNIMFPDNEEAAGIIATGIENGQVINCNIINGTLYNPQGPGGMIAGTFNGGTIKDCVIEGTLISASTASSTNSAYKLIGENPTGEVFIENVNSGGIIIN